MKRIGFVGSGKIALHHAKAVEALDGEIVAFHSRSCGSPRVASFQSAFPRARFFSTLPEILDYSLDAIVCCASWDQIERLLPTLCAWPKPVLFEKPVALTAKRMESIFHSKFLPDNKWVGYNRRYYSTVARLREKLITDRLLAVEVVLPEQVKHLISCYGSEISKNILAYSTSHGLDLLLFLLGPLSFREKYLIPDATFTSYRVLLETQQSVPVWLSIQAEAASPVKMTFEFADETRWELSPFEILSIFKGCEIIEAAQDRRVRTYRPKLIERFEEDQTFKPGLLPQMREFFSQKRKLGASLQEAHELLRFIEKLGVD